MPPAHVKTFYSQATLGRRKKSVCSSALVLMEFVTKIVLNSAISEIWEKFTAINLRITKIIKRSKNWIIHVKRDKGYFFSVYSGIKGSKGVESICY